MTITLKVSVGGSYKAIVKQTVDGVDVSPDVEVATGTETVIHFAHGKVNVFRIEEVALPQEAPYNPTVVEGPSAEEVDKQEAEAKARADADAKAEADAKAKAEKEAEEREADAKADADAGASRKKPMTE